jgi:hypothetical protein
MRTSTLALVHQCMEDAALLCGYGPEEGIIKRPEVMMIAEMLLKIRLKDGDFIFALLNDYEPKNRFEWLE